MHALGEAIRLEFDDLAIVGSVGAIEAVEAARRVWVGIEAEFEDLWRMLTEAFPEVESQAPGDDSDWEVEGAARSVERRVVRAPKAGSARLQEQTSTRGEDQEPETDLKRESASAEVIAGEHPVLEPGSHVAGLKDLARDLGSGVLSLGAGPEVSSGHLSKDPFETVRELVERFEGLQRDGEPEIQTNDGTARGSAAPLFMSFPESVPSHQSRTLQAPSPKVSAERGREEEAIAPVASPPQAGSMRSENAEIRQTTENDDLHYSMLPTSHLDEILDALTERIERDYRRFYCP